MTEPVIVGTVVIWEGIEVAADPGKEWVAGTNGAAFGLSGVAVLEELFDTVDAG